MNDIIAYRSNLAKVYFVEGNYQKALDAVQPVMDLADPWDSDFWYMAGQSFEKLGQDQKAMTEIINPIELPGQNSNLF